jgi:glycosyltransferase involved in cell wall biosynthesis
VNIGIDISTWGNRRGFGRFTRELVRSLIKEGPTHEYLLFADHTTEVEGEALGHGQIVRASTRQPVIEAASASGRRSLRDIWAMTRQVLRHDLDVMFFPAVYSYFPVLNRTKIIVTIHDMIPELYPEKVFPNARLRTFWRLKQMVGIWQSSVVLTVSQYSKKEIVQRCGLSDERVHVMYEGPGSAFRVIDDHMAIESVLKRYGVTSQKRFLLYVGGMSPHKNLSALIGAYEELIADPGFEDVRLVLVGEYLADAFYSDYPALRQLVQQSQLGERVVFTGFIEDQELACLYNAASCFVLPSLVEGFGLPAVEAMACGTPVVASRAGSLPEILDGAGELFDPLDPRELLTALRVVLSDRTLRATMRARGLERAQRFGWPRAAAEFTRLCERLVA